MIRKVRINGRKCVSKTLSFVLSLVETVFLMINRNTVGKKTKKHYSLIVMLNTNACNYQPCFLTGPSVVLQDAEKRTPLHVASFLGDADIIELLILSGKLASLTVVTG